MGCKRVHTEYLYGDLMQKDHLDDLGVDERMILKWISKKCAGEDESIWLRIGTGDGRL
jgi:hypothetical protein